MTKDMKKIGLPVKFFMFLHAKKRAKERYSKKFSDTQYRQILKLVKDGKVMSEIFLSWKRREYKVFHNKEVYRVVYDIPNERIVTFLPQRRSN